MKQRFVLIHSPLVGPLTWQLVADALAQRGEEVIVPALRDAPNAAQPFWQQHVNSIAAALVTMPMQPLVLVAHSGAGPLLPAIRQALPNPIIAYIFVDAGLPQPNATRLDLMHREDPAWAAGFAEYLRQGQQYPTWTTADLQEIVPNDQLRQQLVNEQQPRGLAFFSEPIPVFAGWPDAHCAYVHLSAPYNSVAQWAAAAGWPVVTLAAGHFHMLVDPGAIAASLQQCSQAPQP